MKCLNKSIPAIKSLIDAYGEVQASKILDVFKERIPTIDEAESVVNSFKSTPSPHQSDISDTQIEDQFNLRNDDGSRKRYTSENKALDIARKLNKENKERPYKFTVIKVMGEKGGSRVYWAIKVVERKPVDSSFSLNETVQNGQPPMKSEDSANSAKVEISNFEKQVGLNGYSSEQIEILENYNRNVASLTGKTKSVPIEKLPPDLQLLFKKKGMTHAEVYETTDGGFVNYRVTNLQDLIKTKHQTSEKAIAQETSVLSQLAREKGTALHNINEEILNELSSSANPAFQLNTLRDLDFNLWFGSAETPGAFAEFKKSDAYAELLRQGKEIFLNTTKTGQFGDYVVNDSNLMVDKLVKSMMSLYHEVYITQNRINQKANRDAGITNEDDMFRHKPIFMLEKPFLDGPASTAGTMDLFVIYSDGTAAIHDHKFTGMNIKRKDYESPTPEQLIEIKRIREAQGLPTASTPNEYQRWHYELPTDLYLQRKEESWNAQVGRYAEMVVKLYGVKSIREARIHAVATSYTQVPTGEKGKDRKGKAYDKKAYSVEKSKVEIILTGLGDLGKSQIALEVEKTGDVGLDRFIQMLIDNKHKLNEERIKKQRFDDPRYTDRINALDESIQALLKSRDISHISKSIEKLANQIKSDVDSDGLTFEQIINHLTDIETFKSFIELSSMEIEKLESAYKDEVSESKPNPYTVFKSRLGTSLFELDRQATRMQDSMTAMISAENAKGGYMSEGVFDSYSRQIDMNEAGKLFTHLRESNHPIISLFSQLLDKVETTVINERQTLQAKVIKSVDELKIWGASKGLKGNDIYKDIITEKEDLIYKFNNYKKDVFPEHSDPKNKVNNQIWFKDNFERTGRNEEIFQARLTQYKEYYKTIAKDDADYTKKVNEWLNQNDVKYNNGKNDAWFNQYVQHWLTPVDPEPYYSDEYKKLLKPENKPLLNFYNMYVEQVSKLAVKADFVIRPNMIANIRKDMIDTMVQDTVLKGIGQQFKNIKNFWTEIDADDGFQNVQDGSRKGKQVPIFFDKAIGKGNKSLDLSKSLMLYSDFVNKYRGIKDIEHASLAMRELFSKTQGIETNLRGQVVRGADGVALLKGDSNKKALDAFDTWIDYYIYGETKKGNAKLNKIVSAATMLTATKSIAMNHVSAIAGHANGEMQLQMFTKKVNLLSSSSLSKARKVRKSFSIGLDNFRKGKDSVTNVDSKALFASLFFEVAQGSLSHEIANSVSASTMRKVMNTDPMYFFQRWSDDVIDNTTLFTMMMDFGIDPVTGKTYNLNRLKELYKNNHSVIASGPMAGTKYSEIVWESLWDMTAMDHKIDGEKHPAIINQFTGERMSDATYTDFRRKVRQLISRAKGNMSGDDVAGYKTHMAGRLLMQYRSWIPATITERVKKEGYNLTMEQFEVGRWVAAHQMLTGTLRSKWSAFALQIVPFIDGNFTDNEGTSSPLYAKYQQFIADNPHLKPNPNSPSLDQVSYEQYYNTYVSELKALAKEIQFYLAISAVFMIFCMMAGDDELKENPVLRGTAALLERVQMEIGFYLPFLAPSETLEIVTRKPIAATDVITGGMSIILNTGEEIYDTLLGADWNKTVVPRLGSEPWSMDYAPRTDNTTWGYYSRQWIPPVKFADHILGITNSTKKADTWWDYAFGDGFVK